MLVRRQTSVLGSLAEDIRHTGARRERWQLTYAPFRNWVDTAGLRTRLRSHLNDLSPSEAAAVAGRSRETTTHFAWCLYLDPDAEFSFWLHEYKPQKDWRAGYADSVHNHRYHFCTAILNGGYLHERYDAEIDPAAGLVTSTVLQRSDQCAAGESGVLLASEFHRIPKALDGTMTFLIKSRPVYDWSLSYDPSTGVSHRHVPVETRLGELTQRI
ncbi:hypothetical protein [Amycolatopsis sp. CA-230715]|uniref:hypothetical protein n=1 Tax=Amycolatopsis sp. CA-230715 TaxID=2745196 RepID=UPI001C01F533|nr:hypothetical protein [Amycolatopsis sp. CA-230715]QWF78522.1 hypothetical protein HUW46_01918 [Amycolatopsis sp. CA-230715]